MAGFKQYTDLLDINENGGLQANSYGTVQLSLTSADSPYTITDATPGVINCDTTSGDITVIPMSVALGKNKQYTIVKSSGEAGTNRVVINPPGVEQIHGSNTLSILKQYQSYTITSDGTQYNILSSNIHNITDINLGNVIDGSVPPTLYENTGAGFQYSFDPDATNTILFNSLIPRGYNGEDMTFAIGGQLFAFPPGVANGDSIVLRLKYLVVDEIQGTTDVYTSLTGTITETFDLTGLTEDKAYLFAFSTKLTGKLRGLGVFCTFERLGADLNDDYQSTLDIFGGKIIY